MNELEKIYPFLSDTQLRDTDGSIMPWYTHGALDYIKRTILLDIYTNNLSVLEFGGGHSTLWWRKHSKYVTTVEYDEKACNILGIETNSPKIYFSDAENTNLYDIVIIDSEAEISRQDYIITAFGLCKKYFIVDNFQQNVVCIYPTETVDYLFNNSKECHIFRQTNHGDGTWKTAIFIK